MDKINGCSCSCFLGYEEGADSEFEHNHDKQSGGVPVVTDDAVHAPTGTVQFEDSIACECHEGCSLDDIVDGDTSFMTICGAAFKSSVAVCSVPGISEEKSCRKLTCGVPLDVSFEERVHGDQCVFPGCCDADLRGRENRDWLDWF